MARITGPDCWSSCSVASAACSGGYIDIASRRAVPRRMSLHLPARGGGLAAVSQPYYENLGRDIARPHVSSPTLSQLFELRCGPSPSPKYANPFGTPPVGCRVHSGARLSVPLLRGRAALLIATARERDCSIPASSRAPRQAVLRQPSVTWPAAVPSRVYLYMGGGAARWRK